MTSPTQQSFSEMVEEGAEEFFEKGRSDYPSRTVQICFRAGADYAREVLGPWIRHTDKCARPWAHLTPEQLNERCSCGLSEMIGEDKA